MVHEPHSSLLSLSEASLSAITRASFALALGRPGRTRLSDFRQFSTREGWLSRPFPALSPCLLTTTKQEKYKWGKNKVGVLVLTEEQLAKENSTAKNDTAAEESNQQQPKVSRVFGEFKSANAARENLPPPPPAKRPSADSPTEASPVSSEIAPDAPVVYRVPWLKMKEVAPGWIMHTDKKTGRPFYHHAGSGKTT